MRDGHRPASESRPDAPGPGAGGDVRRRLQLTTDHAPTCPTASIKPPAPEARRRMPRPGRRAVGATAASPSAWAPGRPARRSANADDASLRRRRGGSPEAASPRPPPIDRCLDLVELLVGVLGADAEQVAAAASARTAASGMPISPLAPDHVERVRDDHAGEAELVAQQSAEDGRREGRRLVGVDLRQQDVRRHHGPRRRRRPPPRTAPARGARASSRERSTTGSARCESVSVSPCPGKCLTLTATPAAWWPRDPRRGVPRASSGSAPKLRTPMTGFAGVRVHVGRRREVEVAPGLGAAQPRCPRRRAV